MHDLHEVLIYAGASTTYQAEQRYKAQAAACLNFQQGVLHVTTVPEECATPERQMEIKIITPSTVRSDRSDLVPDSQHISVVSRTHVRACPESPNIERPSLGFSRTPSISLSNQNNIRSRSVIQFDQKDHQCSPLDASMGDVRHKHDRSVLELWDVTMSDYVPTARSVTSHAKGEAHHSRPDVENNKVAIPVPVQAIGISSLANARDALADRMRIAAARRSLNHCGLGRISPPLHKMVSPLRSPATSDIPLSIAPASHLLVAHPDSKESLGATTNAKQPSDYRQMSQSKPVCVDKYLTIATDEQHGPDRTPTSDERTTDHSDRTQCRSLLSDVSLHTLSDTVAVFAGRIGEGRCQPIDNIPASREIVLNHDASGSFVLAQLDSPFYIPTFGTSSCNSEHYTIPTRLMSHADQQIHTSRKNHENTVALRPAANVVSATQEDDIFHQTPAQNKLSTALRTQSYSSSSRRVLLDHLQSDRLNNVKIRESLGTENLGNKTVSRVHSRTSQSGITRTATLLDVRADSFCQTERNAENLDHRDLVSGRQKALIEKDFEICVPEIYRSGNEVFCLPPGQVDSCPSMDSNFLGTLKVPRKFRFLKRNLEPFERGYWLLDLRKLCLSIAETQRVWHELVMVIRSNDLRWISLQFLSKTIRVYCYGYCALQVWTIIYATSRKVKKGITWTDARGHAILSI